jgi:glucose/arabinose dehydrogenase
VIESGRSAILRVTVTGATAGADAAGQAKPIGELMTIDGAQLRLDLITDQLEAPTALAFARDGRTFIAERQGRVRVLRDGTFDERSTFILHDVLMTSSVAGGLLGLELGDRFEQTRFVYTVYTTEAGEGTPRFRVARFREVNGRLGERALVLNDIPAAPTPAAALTIGPDEKLYSAFDDAGDPARARARASYNGKVLRLNPDGTTPPDQPAGSPVYWGDLRSPRGVDWHPVTGALWVLDGGGTNEALRVVDAGGSSVRTNARPPIPLPARTGAASIAFYRGNLLPAFQGDLLVAADEGRHLLRVRLDKRDPTRVVSTERLLQDTVGRVKVVSVGPDGAIYLCTDRALMKLTPN